MAGHPPSEPQTTAVSALCNLGVDLVESVFAEHNDLLCIHGAAAHLSDGLALFLGGMHAGKSTLCAELLSRGIPIFGDDLVALDESLLCRSFGIAPRLRLPLPPLSARTRAFITRHRGPDNGRYLYLSAKTPDIAAYGSALPIHSIILLERLRDGPASLHPVSQSDVIGRLARQNFLDEGQAVRVLERCQSLAAGCTCLALRYARTGEAVDLICDALLDPDKRGSGLPDPLIEVTQETCADLRSTSHREVRPDELYTRHDGVSLRDSDHGAFLVPSDGSAIFRLDPLARAVWSVLTDAASPDDISDLLMEAFPDQDRTRLQADTLMLFRRLYNAGLIMVADGQGT